MRLAKLLLMAVVAVGLLSSAASAATVTYTVICVSPDPVPCPPLGPGPCPGEWQLWATCSEGDNYGLAGYAVDFAPGAVVAASVVNMGPKCDFDSAAASKLGFTLARSANGTEPVSGAQDSTMPGSIVKGIGLAPGGHLGTGICYAGGVQLDYGLGQPGSPVPLSGNLPNGDPMAVELAPGSVLLATGTTDNCCELAFTQLAANVWANPEPLDTGALTAQIELVSITNCIPEPSTWVLLLMGGLSLLIWRRRK